MGTSCSTSRSLSGHGSGAGDDVSAQHPYRCIPHSHRTAQHAASPYPKSPLYRLHALLPSSPFPCLNGLLRLKHCSLRIDPAASSSSSSSSAAVSSVSSAALQPHLYVNVVHSTDGICELISRAPVGSFALYVVAQPHQAQPQRDRQTLSLRIAYHFLPRREQYGQQQPVTSSVTSTRQSGLTFVQTALTAFQLSLSCSDPSASSFLLDRSSSRADAAADSFPSSLYTARLAERSYRQLERVCFVFLPRLRQLLLDATRHPAFVPAQPALAALTTAASVASQLSAAYHESFPLSLSAHTEQHRSGLLLTFASSERRFHLDVDWRREQPRLYCKELSLTIADCEAVAHSLPCFISRAWAAVSGSRSVDDWQALMLDLFVVAPTPLFTATAHSKSQQSQACCCVAAAPHGSSAPLAHAVAGAGSSSSSRDDSAAAASVVVSPKSSLDRRFLVTFLREYATQYSGSRMLESVVVALQPQTLLTPKRGSTTAVPAAKSEEGEERRMKQSVQEMLLKVMEAVRSIATVEQAGRLQWGLDVTDALLHVLCLHAAHHRLTATALSVLQLLSSDSSGHLRVQRMINAHLAAHPLCQGSARCHSPPDVSTLQPPQLPSSHALLCCLCPCCYCSVLLALWSLLSSDAAFCLSAPISTLRCLLSVHTQACLAIVPSSGFASSPLPSLPPHPLNAAAASLSAPLPLEASAALPSSPLRPSQQATAKAVPSQALTSTRQRSATAYPSSMRAALQPKQLNAAPTTVRSISFRAKQPATIPALAATPPLRLGSRNGKRMEAEEEKTEQQQQGAQAVLSSMVQAVETPKAGAAVKGILKSTTALILRQPAETAEAEEEAAAARQRETRSPRDGDVASFSPLQRQATLRPSRSALRLLEKRGKAEGGEVQEEKESSSSSSPVIVSAASPSRSAAAGVVIPKLRLSLALGAQGGGSSLPAALTSMRHSRRATRRTELSSGRMGRAEQQQQTYHMLSPTGLQTRPAPFPSAFSPPPAAARRPSHAHRFSVLDPELPVSSLAQPTTSRRQLDAETRAALRRLREVAMGAGESFVTSQLSCILWHRRQLSQADLALLGWDGLSGSGSAASAAAPSSAQSLLGNGDRRKERLSASSSHWQLPLLSSASSADSGRDAWTAAVTDGSGSSFLRAGDAPLFHCAVLTLRCIQAMMAVQDKAKRRERQRCLTSELAVLTSSLSWLVRAGGSGMSLSAAIGDTALLRLPAAHLRYYRQALCDAIHAASSASLQPASRLQESVWRLRVRLHGSLQSLPLLTTAGLKLPFPRSFASLDAVCLLPSAAALGSAQQQTSSQRPAASPCAVTAEDCSEEANDAGGAVSAAAVMESGADGFYAEMAVRLQAQVDCLSRLQAFTPFADAVEVLSQTASTVQALHVYAIHADCEFGIQPAFACASASSFSLPLAFESLPAFATACRSEFSCACGGGIAQLLRSCGGCLVDLHGQLSRLYRLCKEQAAALSAGINAPLPHTNSGVSAAHKHSSSSGAESSRRAASCPALLEIPRLTAVNALLSLWVSLLSHPSSQSVHELLLRLLRDPTSLPDDASHEQLRYGAASIAGGLHRRSRTMAETALVEQKVALFSLLQFAHDHAILVYAASASSYCLLVQPARRQPDAAAYSQRLSRATTLPPQQTLSSRQLSSSLTGRDSIAISAAQTPQSPPEESDDDAAVLPSALHPAVHSARVLVLGFYRAAAWLLQRAGDVEEQPEQLEQHASEPEEPQPGRERAISAGQSGRSSRTPIAEEDEGRDSSRREQSDDADTQREPEDGTNYAREDSFSPHHLRAERRTQQRARSRAPSSAPAVSARAAGGGATERAGELSWFWSTLSDALHGPHGLIARALQLLIANDTVTASAEEEDDAGDSEDDTNASVDSSSSLSFTAASDDLSEDSPASVSSACSRRLLARRASEFDLLSAYCALWSDLLGWRGGAASPVCPWLQDDRLMDGLVRLHFVAFVRNYHSSLPFDGLRAATCSLHVAVLRAVAQAPSRILHSVSLSPTDRQHGGQDSRQRSEQPEDADPSDAVGASSFSQTQLQSQAEAISGCFLRLRVLHFLSRELNAEHDTFVARSYLATGLAAATAGGTAANTARSIAGFSPQVGSAGSAVETPAARSRGHSPLPSMQLDVGAAVFAPLSPHFNLSKAMSSVLTLQSIANRAEDGATAAEIVSPSHPLPALSAALPVLSAAHGEHRRSASSPVHLAQQESLPPLSEAPSALSLGPTFLLAVEPSLGTPLPLSTHHEEELEEQHSQLSLRRSSAGEAEDGGDKLERQQEEEDEEDEDEGDSGSPDSTLQEETAICRVHADEGDPLFDAASEPASRVHSRTDKDRPRPATGDLSTAQQLTVAKVTQHDAEASNEAAAASRGKEGSEGDSAAAEDGGQEEEDENEDGCWDYSASEQSVSKQRVNPLERLLVLPLAVEPTAAEAEPSVAGGGDAEDEDAEYEASDLSSAVDDPQSTVARPRFQLSLAPAASQSRQGHAEEEHEAKEEAEQPADQEELELDGWSDSDSSQGGGSARGSGQQGIRLQLIIPTASTSSSPSPSASLSQSQGGSELKPSSEPQLTLPQPPRLSLQGFPSLTRPSRSPSISVSAPPEQAGSTPPQQTANLSPPQLLTAVETRSSHSRSSSIVGRPPFTLPALPPLGRQHSQPLLLSPQLDSSLPGMTGARTDSPPPAAQPFLAPPAQPLRGQHSTSMAQSMRALLRSTSSPHHRASLNPQASASLSPASHSDDSSAAAGSAASGAPFSTASLPTTGRLSVRGRSMALKTVSAHDQYARQRQQRRLYAHPALHLDILRLLLRLLVDPSDDCLSALYCDRAVTAAAAKADADVDVLSSLHAHLNHPGNAAILPPLFASSLSPHRSPITRLLKLLVEQLFPSSLFLQPSASQIGRGQFAQVYVARLPGLQQTVAVKQIDASSSAHQRVVLFDLFTEVSVMQRMRQHEGVVQLYEYGVSRGQFYLVMNAASKSLKGWRDELDKAGAAGRGERPAGGRRWAAKEIVSPCFSERQLMLFLLLFRRVLSAMSALHAACIVHFDLKLDNVLLDMAAPADPASWSVCLADFGESLSLQHSAAGGSSISRGTENIQSPEMLLLTQVMDSAHHAFDRRRNNVVGAASDVWSLGCLFFELLTNRMLFEAAHGLPIVLRVTSASASAASPSLLSEADQALLGSFGGRPNRCLLRFLSSVLVQNKDRRPTLRKVQRLFEQMVDELFPGGLLPDGDGRLLLDPPAVSRAAPGRSSVAETAGKRVNSRSFSVQLEASATPPLPALAFRSIVEQPVSFRAEGAQTPPLAAPSASRARRMQRFTSSRRLSAASNASPLAFHYSPLSDELKLPTHSVLAALSVGARHGKAAAMQAELYFLSSGVACHAPRACPHEARRGQARHCLTAVSSALLRLLRLAAAGGGGRRGASPLVCNSGRLCVRGRVSAAAVLSQ